VIDKKLPGVSVRPLSGFMGWCYEVKFDSVKVPGSAVLGGLGAGHKPLGQAIEKAIPILCAYQVGGCQAVFEMSVERSQTREQFGTPIGRFQRIQDHIIDIANHLDAARWTTYEALWKLDTGKPARESVHMAKAVTSEAYFQACTSAHYVHGGIGYSESFGLTLHTKMSRGLYHQLGDPRHHRRQLAGLLGF
jgi:alkylation response protein AidB-like acyl-CoA dehydrogenase